MITEASYAYMLHNVPGCGNKTLFALLEEFGSCKAIFEADEDSLKKLLNVKQLKSFASVKRKWNLESEFEHLYNQGIDFYPYSLDSYPSRLRDIPDPPFALYCIGHLPDEHRRKPPARPPLHPGAARQQGPPPQAIRPQRGSTKRRPSGSVRSEGKERRAVLCFLPYCFLLCLSVCGRFLRAG